MLGETSNPLLARQLLIGSIESTFEAASQQEIDETVTIRSVGIVAVLGGLAAPGPGKLHPTQPVHVNLVRHLAPTGEPLVSVVTSGGYISERQVSLEITDADEDAILRYANLAVDNRTRRCIDVADYDKRLSQDAAINLLHQPEAYGLIKEQ